MPEGVVNIGQKVSGRRMESNRYSPSVFLWTETADRSADRWQVVLDLAVSRRGLVEI